MIIRTNVNLPKVSSTSKVEEPKVIEKIDEEVVVIKPMTRAEKRKKSTPVIEPVVEETVEDEDLSEWLKEHTED
jgi:hypothetical protein